MKRSAPDPAGVRRIFDPGRRLGKNGSPVFRVEGGVAGGQAGGLGVGREQSSFTFDSVQGGDVGSNLDFIPYNQANNMKVRG